MAVKTMPYVVRSGDYLTAIAHSHGVESEAIWSHPSNERLKQLRRNPEILAPGDVIYIPVVERKWLPVQVGMTNRFVATVKRVPIKLVLRDDDGPIKSEKFVVAGGRTRVEGTTGRDGRIAFQVDVLERVVLLELPDRGYSMPLHIGGIDPAETRSGCVARLHHLGYLTAQASQSAAGDLDTALRTFQADEGLAVTGTMDVATVDALCSRFGG